MGSGSVNHQVLFLNEVNAEDDLVPGQSAQDIHWPPYLPSLEIHQAVESPRNLDVGPEADDSRRP